MMERREVLRNCLGALGAMRASGTSKAAPVVNDLPNLSAVSAVNAMRRGDIRAEDYARTLLTRAEGLRALNAFRYIDADAVLEQAWAADKGLGAASK